MTGYVPPEERARQTNSYSAAASAAAHAWQQAAAARVTALLDELRGRDTNCYLVILRSAKGPRWLYRGKSIVDRPGRTGGPTFYIAEVLEAYRIEGGIVEPYRKDHLKAMTFDAFVVPDGRVWRFAGHGESANTYELLASSVEHVHALAETDLKRVATALRSWPSPYIRADRLPVSAALPEPQNTAVCRARGDRVFPLV